MKNEDITNERMFIIRDFLDEFYNKTVFRDGDKSGANISPSLIKFLFAFTDPDLEYPIGEIGRNARVKRSTITDMVDRMEKDKIAERMRDTEDRRIVKVRLTAKGKKMRKDFYKRRREEFLEIFEQLGNKDTSCFISHLNEALKILRQIT
jgi:DNA-binding MarR family transcriptional regulator